MALLMGSSLTFAQLKINSSGNVRVGSGNPSGTYDLIVGSGPYSYALETYGYLKLSTYYYGIYIDQGPSYDLEMYPMSPNYCNLGRSDLYFRTVYANNFTDPSDRRIKENIKNIDSALDKILNLEGVQYDLKKEFAYQDSLPMSSAMIEKFEKERKDNYGFIAQDVEKVLPSVVLYDDSTDMYSMNYMRITPVIVNAIKEQQEIIDNLMQEISELKSGGSENFKSEDVTNDDNIDELGNTPLLFQNKPNPFNEKTVIEYYIPQSYQKASLYIYDMQGL